MISILMPLHNGSEFLRKSTKSVLNQTVPDWELLIGLNGVSPQETEEVVAKIDKLHEPRIRVMSFTERSKSKTLNALTNQAKYDIICLLDVDDGWAPQKLEKQLPFIERYDVVGTDCNYFGKKRGSPGIFLGELSLPMFSFQNPVINSSVMLKKADAYWDEEWEGLDDYNLWVELLAKGKTFYNVPEILTRHRIHKRSYFNNNNEEMHQKLMLEKLTKLDDEQLLMLGKIMDEKTWKL